MKFNLFIYSCIVLTFATAFLVSCDPAEKQAAVDTTYTVNVTLRGLDSGTLLLTYQSNGEYVSDTARSTTGQYVFTGKSAEPRKAYLQIKDARVRSLAFYLENGKITILASRDSLANGTVTGTTTNEESKQLEQSRTAINKRMDDFYRAYENADKSNKKLVDSLDAAYEVLDSQQRAASLEFIASHPRSYVSAYEVNDIFIYNPDVKEFDKAFNQLDSSLRVSQIGRQVSERLTIAKQTDINQVAPDFTLNDVNEKPVSLSSLRGKYLLIDFWASWCGPCRRENPNLVKTYKAFNKKGFEIVGVSLDYPGEKDKWLGAIKKDNLTWLQLSDLKGWKSAVAGQYGIMAIPMNFLLDPEGRIVGKGLRGADLEAKLASLLSPPAATN